jgi:putative transposase
LEVTRQAFYDHLSHKNAPWKYQALADEMIKIHEEDQYNDCYGRERMYLALQQRKAAGKTDIDIPCEATVRKVMVQIGLIHKPRRKPNGITKADRLAQKSDDLLRRDFYADRPLKKAVTDMSEVKAKDGKLYVSAIFDCFDLMPLGIAIEDNMRASLCCHTLENANKSYPDIKGCIIHSDRGSQYTSEEYRAAVKKYGIIQSMNSAGGRCHDNARCESMWARMKEELFYSREDKPENYTMKELKTMIWRYYMSYWANRRICTANGGLPPAARRKLYYDHIFLTV